MYQWLASVTSARNLYLASAGLLWIVFGAADAAYIPGNIGTYLNPNIISGGVSGTGAPGIPSQGVMTIQGIQGGTPLPVIEPPLTSKPGNFPVQAATTPSTANIATGTANSTSNSGVTLIQANGSNRIYVTAFSCANTGSTTSLASFTNGVAGATLWATVNPTAAGSNMNSPTPLFATNPGSALGWTPGSASTTQYCSAAGIYAP